MSSVLDLTRAAFVPVRAAVQAGAIPGAVLGVVNAQGARGVLHAGHAQIVPEPVPLDAETWFDLASLTKVLFTTVQILEEAGRGRIDLDAPLTSLLPDLRQYEPGCRERAITFRQCLGHLTPLPAVEPLYTYGQDRADLRAFILQRRWVLGEPVYSDINFILLGLALERLRGCAVSQMEPGWRFSFHPPARQCAATEACPWRARVLRGEVHDENAFALGGAGHAGLFGRIGDVLDFAHGLLSASGLTRQTIALMRTPLSETRSHGWERAHDGWSGGDGCNATVIGHTGFTGTGLWVDFERGLAWALLTNRVHPTRHRETGIAVLRRAVAERLAVAAGG